MALPLFNRIVTAITNYDPFFHNNTDCTGREGISPLIKCTSAIRQLAYGVNGTFLDEYMQISERSSRMALDHFCEAVMEIYGPEILRKPTEWLGCPYAFKGQYVRRDHGSNPFILIEAVASQDLWIWHAFFGVAGSNNDINVLYQSPLFNDLKTGPAPEIPFVANGVKPVDDDHKRILYKQKQESARKDVERASDVLKKKWVMEMVNSMLSYSGLSKGFWGEAMLTACYVINRVSNKGTRLTHMNFESRDAIFDENRFSSIPKPKDIIPYVQESQIDDHTDDVPSEIPEPRKEVIHDEIGSIMGNDIWALFDLPSGCKPIGIDKFKARLGIIITQSYYIEKILKKFNREDCSPVSTPMNPVEKLKLNTEKPVDQLEYSRAIGCLMYAMTSTRPNIAYVVGRLSSFYEWMGVPAWGVVISWASKKQTCITGPNMKSEFMTLTAQNG
uniref:Reverse transcriptase Ty1/copia-type domain-containing protein n=1 Tax=Tanacetum cinerariifolium TaxID=118510 RepID=A0A6L2MG04_TANCI|nr:hypothetical protein [Tanacetum cinerariifolium]